MKTFYVENEKRELRYFRFRFFARLFARKTARKTNKIVCYGQIL
jgi:hypothetical protein